MSKTKLQKQQIVTGLVEEFKNAHSLIFTDYKGLNMSQLSQIRNSLSVQKAKITITKNTLLRIALKNSGYSAMESDIESGPTATMIACDDEIAPLKILVKALKDAQFGIIKAGFLGHEYLNGTELIRLSQLPSKLELRAQVVGLTASPLRGLVTVLQGNLKNLVYVIGQISQKKT